MPQEIYLQSDILAVCFDATLCYSSGPDDLPHLSVQWFFYPAAKFSQRKLISRPLSSLPYHTRVGEHVGYTNMSVTLWAFSARACTKTQTHTQKKNMSVKDKNNLYQGRGVSSYTFQHGATAPSTGSMSWHSPRVPLCFLCSVCLPHFLVMSVWNHICDFFKVKMYWIFLLIKF